jgi:hypothetical protein
LVCHIRILWIYFCLFLLCRGNSLSGFWPHNLASSHQLFPMVLHFFSHHPCVWWIHPVQKPYSPIMVLVPALVILVGSHPVSFLFMASVVLCFLFPTFFPFSPPCGFWTYFQRKPRWGFPAILELTCLFSVARSWGCTF